MTRLPNSLTQTTPATTTTRAQSTSRTLPHPSPRNAPHRTANKRAPRPPRSRALLNPLPPCPSHQNQSRGAPNQSPQMAISIPQSSLRTPRLLQITLSSVRSVHTRPLLAIPTCITDTLLNPSAALQSTAEDFLHTLSQSAEAAQAEFINCILRACGCNDSVDADQAIDYDGVVDSLDNFTEGLKQVTWLITHKRSC